MGPAEPIARSESIVNNVINFIRALSPTERRTQFIAIGIFAGLSSVTAILWSCYKKFHHKATVLTTTKQISEPPAADKIFKDANLMALLSRGGEEGCAKASEIVKLPAEILRDRYPEFIKEIEMAHSLHLKSLFYKFANRKDEAIGDYISKNVFAVNNEALQIRNQISNVYNQMLDIWSSKGAEFVSRRQEGCDAHGGMYNANTYFAIKIDCFNFNGLENPFQEAIEMDQARGEPNIFTWVNLVSIAGVVDKKRHEAHQLELEKIGKRVRFFSPGLLLLQDSEEKTVLSYLLINFTKYLPNLQSFDPQPHQNRDKGFLEEVLKNHPVLLEKFIFSEVYLNDVMPMILEFLGQGKYLVSIANFCQFAQIVITYDAEKYTYQKCSDRISESLELLDTDQEMTGLKNLAACARCLTGTPTFLTLEDRRKRWQKAPIGFSGCKPLRDNFFFIQRKFAQHKDLQPDYDDIRYAAYPQGNIPTDDSFIW